MYTHTHVVKDDELTDMPTVTIEVNHDRPSTGTEAFNDDTGELYTSYCV